MTQQQQTTGEKGDDERQGLLGKLFGGGGKSFKKAKMGMELQMYYNEELKCWVTPGEEEDKKKEMATGPPPTSSASISSVLSGTSVHTEHGKEGGHYRAPVPGMRATVTSRYAAMPTLKTNDGTGGSSILAGLRPPPLGAGGPLGPGVSTFKPEAAVFSPNQPEAIGGGEQDGSQLGQDMLGQDMQEQSADAQRHQVAQQLDPRVVEVLSFWSYYRSEGYGVDVMKEWVEENYDEDLTRIDCEEMLQDDAVSSIVQKHIEENKRVPVEEGRMPTIEGLSHSAVQDDTSEVAQDWQQDNEGAYMRTESDVYNPSKEDIREENGEENKQVEWQAEKYDYYPDQPQEASPPAWNAAGGGFEESEGGYGGWDSGVQPQEGGWDDQSHQQEGGWDDQSHQQEGGWDDQSHQQEGGWDDQSHQQEGGWDDQENEKIGMEATDYETYHYHVDAGVERGDTMAVPELENDGMENKEQVVNSSVAEAHEQGAYYNDAYDAVEGPSHSDQILEEFPQQVAQEEFLMHSNQEYHGGDGLSHDIYAAEGDQYAAEGHQYAAEGDQYAAEGDQYAAEGDQYAAEGDQYAAEGEAQEGVTVATKYHASQGWNETFGGGDDVASIHTLSSKDDVDNVLDSKTSALVETDLTYKESSKSFDDSNEMLASAPLIQGSRTESGYEGLTEPQQPVGISYVPSSTISFAEQGHREEQAEDETVLASRFHLEEIEMLKKQLEEAENMIAEKSNAVEEVKNSLNEIIENKNNKLFQLEEDLENANAKCETIQAEMAGQAAAAEGRQHELEQELQDIREASTALRSEIVDLSSQLKEACNERDQAVENMKSQKQAMEYELSEARDKISSLELEVSVSHENAKSSAALQCEVDALKLELEKANDTVGNLTAEMEELETSLRKEMEEIQEKTENEFQVAIDERDAEIMQLEAKLMLAEQSVESARENAKKEIEEEVVQSMHSRQTELESTVELQQSEIECLQGKLKDVEKKVAVAKKKIQAQQNQIEKLQTENNALTEQLKTKETDINCMQEQRQGLEQEKTELISQIETLRTQLSTIEHNNASAIRGLDEENAKLMDILGEKEDHLESLNAELAELRAQMEQYSSLHEDMLRWEDAASAAQEALLQEKEAKDIAQAQTLELEQRMAMLIEQLNAAQATASEASGLQQELDAQHMRAEEIRRECDDYKSRLEEAHATIERAQADIEELSQLVQHHEDAGSNTEELEQEVSMLRHQLQALSEGAAQKEDELRKYKLQLVKAKKLRAADQEKIEELKEVQEEYESKLQAAMQAMQEEQTSTQQYHTPQAQDTDIVRELTEAQDAFKEAEEGLNEALTALGQEEAKVLRLVELLKIAGLTEEDIEEELAAVEEEIGYGE